MGGLRTKGLNLVSLPQVGENIYIARGYNICVSRVYPWIEHLCIMSVSLDTTPHVVHIGYICGTCRLHV